MPDGQVWEVEVVVWVGSEVVAFVSVGVVFGRLQPPCDPGVVVS